MTFIYSTCQTRGLAAKCSPRRAGIISGRVIPRMPGSAASTHRAPSLLFLRAASTLFSHISLVSRGAFLLDCRRTKFSGEIVLKRIMNRALFSTFLSMYLRRFFKQKFNNKLDPDKSDIEHFTFYATLRDVCGLFFCFVSFFINGGG